MRARALHLFIVVYVLLQVALPVRGILVDKSQGRSDFSWNMYSEYSVTKALYLLTPPNASTVQLDPARYLNRPSAVQKLFYPDRLPFFHAWLCAQLAAEGRLGRLSADITVTAPPGPPRSLASPAGDLCGAAIVQ
jgi:hypothetical protein